MTLEETQSVVTQPGGDQIVNGAPASRENVLRPVGNMEVIAGKSGRGGAHGAHRPVQVPLPHRGQAEQGAPVEGGEVRRRADKVSVYYAVLTDGNRILRPGLKFKVEGTPLERIDFASLMIALFLGTAALPHILIRYYTVPSPAAARKSTIVAIAAIGFFYVLTLFMGLGAMTSGVINLTDNNMSAPLLARSFGTFLFSMISAIAFATVLGHGERPHHRRLGRRRARHHGQVRGGDQERQAEGLRGKGRRLRRGRRRHRPGHRVQGRERVTFLVGLAFAVAASANLPAILMMLFWKKTTGRGITASIIVGVVSSIGLILLSPTMYELYGLDPLSRPDPAEEPRDHLHPAQLPRDHRGVAAHAEERHGKPGRRRLKAGAKISTFFPEVIPRDARLSHAQPLVPPRERQPRGVRPRGRGAGLDEICFTPHIPLPGFRPGFFNDKLHMDLAEFDAYEEELARTRALFPSLSILSGVEADYIEGRERFVEGFLAAHEFDLVLMSVHFVARVARGLLGLRASP